MTDSKKEILSPYNTNNDNIIYIDMIEESDDGTVTLKKGNDVMVINIHHATECHDGQYQTLHHDFDEVTGALPTASNYPMLFDWKCDILGTDVSFCKILKDHQTDLQQVGPNVCVQLKPLTSERCPSSLQVTKITGFFHDTLYFLPQTFESFETEWLDREYSSGLLFPCLSSDFGDS